MATDNTFGEQMKKVYSQIGEATLAPDADIDFATKLQMVIRGYLTNRAGAQAPGGVAAGPGGGMPAPSGAPGGQGGPPSGMGGGGMGMVPGMPSGPPPGGMGGNPGGGGAVEQMTDGDELRRILGGAVG